MNGVKDNLCRTLSLLSLDARVKALRLAFEGSTRPRAAAETIGLSEPQASRFYTELEDVGLVRKQRVGKTLDIVADGDGVLRFLSVLGEALVPGGVVIVPLDPSVVALTPEEFRHADALIAERVVVYDDPLPKVEPDREKIQEHFERVQALGYEGIVPPDPFIDGWDPDGDWELAELKSHPGWEDRGDKNVDSDDDEDLH